MRKSELANELNDLIARRLRARSDYDLRCEKTAPAAPSMHDQKAQHDVIGKMHGVVACYRDINVTEAVTERRFPPPWTVEELDTPHDERSQRRP
jgi:hypothetical protein